MRITSMPYRKTKFIKGNYYHIFNRGAGRQPIFHKGSDYIHLLGLMKKIAAECAVTIIAYCLMPNHYHWLVRQDGETPAQKLPTRVFGSYVQSFNHWYKRSGTLFEGPFEAIPVGTDSYLHHLCRYIHANPVMATIAMSPALWPYSNYLEWVGERAGTLVDHDFIEAHFPRPSQYETYVKSLLTGQVQLPPGLKKYLDSL